MGQRETNISPLIFSMISRRIANGRTVADALANHAWVQDIRGVAIVEVIRQCAAGDLRQACLAPYHFWTILSTINI